MTIPAREAFPLRLAPEVECLLRGALQRRGVKLDPPKKARRGRPPKEEQDDGER